VEGQAEDGLSKIEAFLKGAGTDTSMLIAVDVFSPNIGDFDATNAVYDSWIDKGIRRPLPVSRRRLANPDQRVEPIAVAAA
jgi:enamine deaminase RidA (YjgF/YER057c/UK114 family)